ncbi:site-specific integrase [Streptomyces hydrogenans]
MADPTIKKITLASGKTRYRFVVDIGRDENGRRKQLTVTKDTKKAAEAELARITHERNNGSFVAPTDLTVSQWVRDWLERKARDIEETSLRAYEGALVHVHERIGHIRLQALTEDDVEDLAQWLVTGARRRGGKPGTGLRVSTAEGVLSKLRECLGRAVVRRMIAVNPAEYVKIPLQAKKQDRKDHRRERPWTPAEVRSFIRVIEDDRLHAPYLLSLMGLRPAEVVGLRWSDVDLTVGTLETANTRTMLGNRWVLEKDTKTEAGERKLPLPSKAAEALRKFRARQAAERLAAGEGYTETPYVVVNELGLPLNIRQLRERAYSLMHRHKLRRVRLYDARHSCLTYLANNGVPDHILATWAGHTSASFTKRRYVHPDVEDLRPAATAWDVFHSDDRPGVSEKA